LLLALASGALKEQPLSKRRGEMKNLIFDLDNTLVNSDDAYSEALHSININMRDRDFKLARNLVKSSLTPLHTSARNRTLYLKAMLEIQSRFSPTSLFDMTNAYERVLELSFRTQWVNLKRDELFRRLAQKYRLFILTNENTRTQMLKLRALDPDWCYFSGVLTSEEVGLEKPNDSIFNEAFQRFKVQPEESVMIGDSVLHDIIPAIRKSMKAVHSTEFTKTIEKTPVGAIQVQTLNSIEAVMSKW
jgi:putative hydrolase of the HAD superfamily